MTKTLRLNGAGVALVLLMTTAAATAFFRLGAHSLWFDEISGARVAELRPLAAVMTSHEMDSHPPAMAVAEHWSRYAFGLTEWSLRLPAALASVLAVAVIVAWGAVFGDVRVGWLAAALAVVSLSFVTYAQDARPYALAMLFTAAASVCFLWGFRGRRPYLWFALYAVAAALALYAHYFAMLVLGAHMLVAVAAWVPALRPAAARRGRRFALLFAAFAGAWALALASAYPLFSNALEDRARFPGGEMSVTPAVVWGALASVGWDRAAANVLFLGAAVVGVVFLWRRRGRFAALAVACFAVVPVFAPLVIIRFTTQFWNPRFSYFGFGAFVVVAAFGFVAGGGALARAAPRRLAAALLTVAMAAGVVKAMADDARALYVHYTNEVQDFRGAVALTNRNRDLETPVLVWPYRNRDCFLFYTKTQGGPAALAKPREGIYKFFRTRQRLFLVTTDSDLVDELVALYPTTARFRLARLSVLYRDASYRTAADAYRRARYDVVGVAPAVAYNALGKVALRAGDRARARAYFERAAAEPGEESADIFALADLYTAEGEYEKALRLVGGYVRRHPDEPWPYTKLGLIYLAAGDVDSAIAYYRRAVWLNPAKENWRRRLRSLVRERPWGRALFAYSDPRWL